LAVVFTAAILMVLGLPSCLDWTGPQSSREAEAGNSFDEVSSKEDFDMMLEDDLEEPDSAGVSDQGENQPPKDKEKSELIDLGAECNKHSYRFPPGESHVLVFNFSLPPQHNGSWPTMRVVENPLEENGVTAEVKYTDTEFYTKEGEKYDPKLKIWETVYNGGYAAEVAVILHVPQDVSPSTKSYPISIKGDENEVLQINVRFEGKPVKTAIVTGPAMTARCLDTSFQ